MFFNISCSLNNYVAVKNQNHIVYLPNALLHPGRFFQNCHAKGNCSIVRYTHVGTQAASPSRNLSITFALGLLPVSRTNKNDGGACKKRRKERQRLARSGLSVTLISGFRFVSGAIRERNFRPAKKLAFCPPLPFS